jgi:hypothetical protein
VFLDIRRLFINWILTNPDIKNSKKFLSIMSGVNLCFWAKHFQKATSFLKKKIFSLVGILSFANKKSMTRCPK